MNNTIVYNKLVRDKIPEVINQAGKKSMIYTADEKEYKLRLLDKLIEEACELKEDPSLEELADVYEVIDCIKKAFCFSDEDIHLIKEKKKSERGSFKDQIILESVIEEV